jgi:hypothetical protein
MTNYPNQISGGRRRFMASALIGGAGSLLASNSVFAATDSDVADMCAELSAADPLYIYTSLVYKLQPVAIAEGRKFEVAVQTSQAQKLKELGVLSDKLRARLPQRSRAQSAADRLKSLAYIGQTNVEAFSSTTGVRSRAGMRAHAQSQSLIMTEMTNASVALSADVKLSGEAWQLLQELLQKIDEIRNFQPQVEKAREDFNNTIQSINDKISRIQDALMDASSFVVKGDKSSATKRVNDAIAAVKELPGYSASLKSEANKNLTKQEAEALSPNKFIDMLDPGVLNLIEQNQPGATSPMQSSQHHSNNKASSAPDPQTVKAIVQQFLVSGTWWQVVAVAAVCLPLWSYPRTEQRKSLIYSALTAIPRGPNSNLWTAAYYLNQLRP